MARKHIVIVSEESVAAGRYKCGVGEVVDTMASALREYYDVTVLTMGYIPGGRVGCTISLGEDNFYRRAARQINELKPDLVHNFARADLIEMLHVDCPKILSFDQWTDVEPYLDIVPEYDHVVTLSDAYATECCVLHQEALEWPLKGIINGIDGGLYTPHSYQLWSKDATAREAYYSYRGVEDNGDILIVSMGRLVPEKGIDDIIGAARAIRDAGGELVIYGQGDKAYEDALTVLSEAGVLTYYNRMVGYVEMLLALRAADFYLMPSVSEVCGLQAMKAARMGCVPIVTPAGGLGENFNAMNSVQVTGSVAEACVRAINMSAADYSSLKAACEAGEWTWATRILPWVELYGLPTAPRSESDLPTNQRKRTAPFARKEVTVNG